MKKVSFILALVLALSLTSVAAGPNNSGFKTAQPPMLTPVMAGVQVTPILTVGDVLPSGFRYEAVPDGISVRTRGQGRVDLFVNHETSKVPFPYVTAGPTAANSENDFDNAQVSQLILNQNSAGVLNGSFAISSSSGYQRFCSNYLATSKEGFDRDILFTNEEAIDYVFRQEASWPPPIGDDAGPCRSTRRPCWLQNGSRPRRSPTAPAPPPEPTATRSVRRWSGSAAPSCRSTSASTIRS